MVNHHHAYIKLHHERHKTRFALSDIILGGQDGLVNVLGVILGVAAAGAEPRIIIAGGLAATFAESISMGAVAYTSTLADADAYKAEREREKKEIEETPEMEREEVRLIYEKKGFTGKDLDDIVGVITSNKRVWLDVMMSEELGLQPVDDQRAFQSALIVGTSAAAGSFVPLMPFFFLPVSWAIPVSFLVSGTALFAVGAYKAQTTVGRWYRSGLQIMIIGLVSAIVGYAIGLLFTG
jgi:VIT1/CCC1 family predicted Fe2+/Mn2+ transporter